MHFEDIFKQFSYFRRQFTDCPDGSDESEICTSSKNKCQTHKCPIGSKCKLLPDDVTCICPKGYEYDMKKNECQVSGSMYEIEFHRIFFRCMNLTNNFPGH